MGIGVLTGLCLCGPAAQAATAALTASPTSQTFYVNGQRVEFEAYEIHGNNFIKLRDVGKAVDFGVTYDAATNSVRIDPNAHYQEEVTTPAPASAPAPAAPSPSISSGVTEESVQAALARLKELYPTGTVYPSPYISSSKGPYGASSRNCAGWAVLCSDTAFGDLPWRKIDRPSWNQIRPGDLIEYNDSASHHVVVVVSKTDSYIKVTESGLNQKTVWGGQYFQWWLEDLPQYILHTRYPI